MEVAEVVKLTILIKETNQSTFVSTWKLSRFLIEILKNEILFLGFDD